MSGKEKSTCKPFTVKHLLQKDEKRDQEKIVTNHIKARNVQRERDERMVDSQAAAIFTGSPKFDCNSQALNLAERLAGDYTDINIILSSLLLSIIIAIMMTLSDYAFNIIRR